MLKLVPSNETLSSLQKLIPKATKMKVGAGMMEAEPRILEAEQGMVEAEVDGVAQDAYQIEANQSMRLSQNHNLPTTI